MRRPEVIKTTTRSLQDFSKEEIARASLSSAYENQYPIAFWRLPNTGEIHILISFDSVQKLTKVDFEELEKGFVIAPFDNVHNQHLFIKSDLHIAFDFDEISCQFDFNKEKPDHREESFIDSFFHYLHTPEEVPSYHKNSSPKSAVLPDYEEYVDKCVNAIKSEQVQKVVPARYVEVDLKADFDAVDQFMKLGKTYPNAFISLTSIPDTGTWMGATPEVLIEQQGEIFKTVALAATQKRDSENSISDTAWNQKEIEEQAMVSRYIINCFKKIRLREFEEKGPKTVVAGNLLHLKTDYMVNMIETNFPELGTVMLELLHPTSAVAGMPKATALGMIKEWEGFDREFFSGFLGPVHMDDHTNIFVNLRCMQLFGDKARLYAGAGVTEDSKPAKELQETEIKFNTLLNVIGQHH
ncbi:MAG: isochorismate synthase [Roseivirga sp.]